MAVYSKDEEYSNDLFTMQTLAFFVLRTTSENNSRVRTKSIVYEFSRELWGCLQFGVDILSYSWRSKTKVFFWADLIAKILGQLVNLLHLGTEGKY